MDRVSHAPARRLQVIDANAGGPGRCRPVMSRTRGTSPDVGSLTGGSNRTAAPAAREAFTLFLFVGDHLRRGGARTLEHLVNSEDRDIVRLDRDREGCDLRILLQQIIRLGPRVGDGSRLAAQQQLAVRGVRQ